MGIKKVPKRKGSERIILALDPSMSASGWALLKVDANSKTRAITLINCGEILTDSSKPHGQRLAHIRTKLAQVCRGYAIDEVTKEKGFHRFAGVTQTLYKVHGICEERFSDFKIAEYAPTTVKKSVTGSGKASKTQVEDGVRKILDLDPTYVFVSDNASDAVAVGLTHIIKRKYVPIKVF